MKVRNHPRFSRRRLSDWHNIALENVHFAFVVPHWIKVYLTHFLCQTQTQVRVSAKLFIGSNQPLYVRGRDIYFDYECSSHFFVSERQFISWIRFDSIKKGRIKDLKDLSCVWCKSYDADSSLGEKTEHVTGNATWPTIHQFHGHSCRKVVQYREFSRIK
jgi:hypothetical protein